MCVCLQHAAAAASQPQLGLKGTRHTAPNARGQPQQHTPPASQPGSPAGGRERLRSRSHTSQTPYAAAVAAAAVAAGAGGSFTERSWSSGALGARCPAAGRGPAAGAAGTALGNGAVCGTAGAPPGVQRGSDIRALLKVMAVWQIWYLACAEALKSERPAWCVC